MRLRATATCSFPSCERPAPPGSHCTAHRQQLERGRELTPILTRAPRRKKGEAPARCAAEGCERAAVCRALCDGHYQQLRAGKELRPLQEMHKTCTFPACGRPHEARGYCCAHYDQLMDGKELRPLRSTPSLVFHDGSSWVVELYGRGDGGRVGTVVGYAQISEQDREEVAQYRWNLQDNGYVHQPHAGGSLHRLIMKPSTPEEQIDHINGIRTDCRRENLRIVTHAENAQNRGVQRINTTGVRGVTLDPETGKYRAVVGSGGKNHYAGRHTEIEDAERAASELRLKLMTHTNEERKRKVSGT